MSQPGEIELRLYVTGGSPRSACATAALREFCVREFPGRHRLSVIDVNRFPAVADLESVHITPTVVARGGFGVRRLVGDFSNADQLRLALTSTAAGRSHSEAAAAPRPHARKHTRASPPPAPRPESS